MKDLQQADLGASGLILVYPISTAAFSTPLFRAPNEDTVFLVAALRFAPDATQADNMAADNRRWHDVAVELGGTSYPTGTIPFTSVDWTRHLGSAQTVLAETKDRYDPANLFPRRFAQ